MDAYAQESAAIALNQRCAASPNVQGGHQRRVVRVNGGFSDGHDRSTSSMVRADGTIQEELMELGLEELQVRWGAVGLLDHHNIVVPAGSFEYREARSRKIETSRG